MAAGKTYDVHDQCACRGGTALPIFDRQLSLSANATSRDAGMLAYISVNGAALPSAPVTRELQKPIPIRTIGDCGQDAHRVGSRQGCDRQRHQCLWRKGVGAVPAARSPSTRTARLPSLPLRASRVRSRTAATALLRGRHARTVTLGAATIEAATGITRSADRVHVEGGHNA